MRSTLFLVPQFIPGDPLHLQVFGFGWLLILWLVIAVGLVIGWSRWSKSALDWYGLLPYIGLVGVGIVFVLPNLLVKDEAGNVGLPIRTYGLFMVTAVISGVLLAAYRARKMGIDPEVIYTLAMMMTISGIVGARAFFVIQYFNQFWVPGSIVGTLQKIANVPQGGLVVYGAVLGSFPVGVWYLWSRKLPPLVIADITAPSLLMGLAIGRMGCFMNGCCYGGFCTLEPPAVTFPAGSPPYQQQEMQGWRTGVWLKQEEIDKQKKALTNAADLPPPKIIVAYVAPNSAASSSKVKVGEVITKIGGKAVESLSDAQEQLRKSDAAVEIQFANGMIKRWTLNRPPPRSAPVHPAQVYAAVDAGLLALLLWAFYPFRRHDGEVTALMFTLHPMSRFLLEIVRVDEGGQFGTGLTISQWVSIGLFLIGLALWWYVENQPRGSVVPAKRLAVA
ncbi:prolipoprotein diacylglyceryl transferase [Anatilimnocola floriformis]|uniref:prolipoprotein diacylglyceryl transferase n=1 Tax=Anatilimnocola floriformis TaxID=2948575 RepID=UPI0020C3741A|nr:prolipoprotein diacylglyceryl transferase family protein [Anatilimnocola floriformis]